MTASKRKNEEDSSLFQGTTKMVIVDVNNNNSGINNSMSLSGNSDVDDLKVSETMQRMKHLMAMWRQEKEDHMNQRNNSHLITTSADDDDDGFIDDPIAYAIRTVDTTDMEPEHDMVKESEQIHSELDLHLQQQKDLRGQESSELSDLADKLEQFRHQRSELLQEIDELDERQRISQRNIATYVDEASQELEQIDEYEEERKKQVPRLKSTISLYASTTGIKWDFKDGGGTDTLSGQVAVPSKQGFQLFSIDPRDYSTVETADYLWNLMEGVSH